MLPIIRIRGSRNSRGNSLSTPYTTPRGAVKGSSGVQVLVLGLEILVWGFRVLIGFRLPAAVSGRLEGF